MLLFALLDCDTPKFVYDLFFLVLKVSEYFSISHTSTVCQYF